MKVLVVGRGGREHALMWKLAQSPRVSEVVAAPGNAGMAELGRCIDTSLEPTALLALAERERIDLTVVGPEVPLVAGVVDLFEAAGRRIFGPNRLAARLEGSKAFAKTFMQRHNIPTAAFARFTELAEAVAYIEQAELPIVVKDSALAAGKGVTIAHSHKEAVAAARAVLARGGEVVIEAFLTGQEVSLLLLTDGQSATPLLLAQDYKQAYDGDSGPMTGGMGAVAPAPLLSEAQYQTVEKTIITPTLRGLEAEGVSYKGVLYLGLMVTAARIELLEYNARLGDPETQAILPLLKTDLVDVLEAIIDERLEEMRLEWLQKHCACVVMAAQGYPGTALTGTPVTLPVTLPEGVTVFHAGTALEDGRLVSAGGRVLGVSALAQTQAEALGRAYAAVGKIGFAGAHYRRDIGYRLTTVSSTVSSPPVPRDP